MMPDSDQRISDFVSRLRGGTGWSLARAEAFIESVWTAAIKCEAPRAPLSMQIRDDLLFAARAIRSQSWPLDMAQMVEDCSHRIEKWVGEG